MLIDRRRSQLLLIDIQSRLAPHVASGDVVTANCVRLARYARRLGVPITVTEHYPKGLGPSAEGILEAVGNETPRFEKIAFSSWKDDAIRGRIEALRGEGRDQVVVAGSRPNSTSFSSPTRWARAPPTCAMSRSGGSKVPARIS
jgi:nicotinamidase-related amidase